MLLLISAPKIAINGIQKEDFVKSQEGKENHAQLK